MMKKYLISLFILLVLSTGKTEAQKTKEYVSIAFYNLENLFDTLDTPNKRDEEYTPEGRKKWDTEKYQRKLQNMAAVIAQLGTQNTPNGPAVLGVCEVENKEVLADLVQESAIAKKNYQPILIEGPDGRGIDVGLLYQPTAFAVQNTKSYRLTMPFDSTYRTRDQLVVSGKLHGEPFHFVVNHWPSRYGGEEKSRPARIAAAQLTRSIVDSLITLKDKGRIVVMGDFNDDPNNISIETTLNAQPIPKRPKKKALYNTTQQLFEEGKGTLAYRGEWNLFDQLIVSGNLLTRRPKGYKVEEVYILDKPFLRQQEGDYKGYPNRTHAGRLYLGGYSDHFPVFMILKR
ncbi:MAG: endonuclease/exonuclease/phosphatase family protein [Bacteroidota bacterium]